MKPLKGDEFITSWNGTPPYSWKINIPGRVTISSQDSYATRKSATTAAKRFAARCNIVLEPSK